MPYSSSERAIKEREKETEKADFLQTEKQAVSFMKKLKEKKKKGL